MTTRIITGIVGIALAACVIQLGGALFSIAVLLLAWGAWFEFVKAFRHKGLHLSFLLGMLVIFFFWGCAWLGNMEEFVSVGVIAVLLVMTQMVLRHKVFSVEQAAASILGIFYIGLPFALLVLLRFMGTSSVHTPLGNMQLGCALVWIALIGTWSSDTFAYFTGSFCGRHKLCPNISPNKTMEGFAGGVIGTVLALAGLGMFFSFPIWQMAALGLLVALSATVGDLAESVIKRYTGIKDSGNIIPGHGGIWDRFDSVIFTVPVVYYFVQIISFFQ